MEAAQDTRDALVAANPASPVADVQTGLLVGV